MRRIVPVLVTSALGLAACGGGTESGAAPTYESLGALPFVQKTQPFSAPVAVAAIRRQSDGTAVRVTEPTSAGASGTTLARLASGDMTLSSATFAAGDIAYQSGDGHILHNPSVPDPADPSVTLDRLRLIRDASNPLDAAATPKLLSYAAWGDWAYERGAERDYLAFAFGAPTQAGDMPTVGSATYEGRFTSREMGESADYGSSLDQPGRFTATAHFDTARFDGILEGRWTGDVVLSTATFDVPITGTGFAGALAAASGATGTITGAFFGPQAAEMAGTFILELGGTRTSAGSFGAARP